MPVTEVSDSVAAPALVFTVTLPDPINGPSSVRLRAVPLAAASTNVRVVSDENVTLPLKVRLLPWLRMVPPLSTKSLATVPTLLPKMPPVRVTVPVPAPAMLPTDSRPALIDVPPE